ncbi:hypothetical protein [Candidatus Electrothrix sp.]|uniref:hypothetical protein n=1 Tax=Candidatus Electrothrix sp. TaxID=2170559 RepID=UPI004056CF64
MKQPVSSSLHDLCSQIICECFWEYRISVEKLLELTRNGTDQEKYFVFTKCMESSTDILQSLHIFSEDDQRKMISRYRPPKFNHYFLSKRHKIVRYFVTGEEVDIPELEWNV